MADARSTLLRFLKEERRHIERALQMMRAGDLVTHAKDANGWRDTTAEAIEQDEQRLIMIREQLNRLEHGA